MYPDTIGTIKSHKLIGTQVDVTVKYDYNVSTIITISKLIFGKICLLAKRVFSKLNLLN